MWNLLSARDKRPTFVEQFIQFFGGASSENALGVSKVSTRAQESVHVTRCTSLGKIVRRSDLAVPRPSGRSTI